MTAVIQAVVVYVARENVIVLYTQAVTITEVGINVLLRKTLKDRAAAEHPNERANLVCLENGARYSANLLVHLSILLLALLVVVPCCLAFCATEKRCS